MMISYSLSGNYGEKRISCHLYAMTASSDVTPNPKRRSAGRTYAYTYSRPGRGGNNDMELNYLNGLTLRALVLRHTRFRVCPTSYTACWCGITSEALQSRLEVYSSPRGAVSLCIQPYKSAAEETWHECSQPKLIVWYRLEVDPQGNASNLNCGG